MDESKRSSADRMAGSSRALVPRVEAAEAAVAEQAAKFKVAMERVEAARQAAARVVDEDLDGVRLAVERARVEVGKRAP